ncbi:MAG: hypothetical protein S4CHLAM123_09140 [Chlamydiales bacterium]|nr:hypothetical protein [Chlamydiales bacterium]
MKIQPAISEYGGSQNFLRSNNYYLAVYMLYLTHLFECIMKSWEIFGEGVRECAILKKRQDLLAQRKSAMLNALRLVGIFRLQE